MLICKYNAILFLHKKSYKLIVLKKNKIYVFFLNFILELTNRFQPNKIDKQN